MDNTTTPTLIPASNIHKAISVVWLVLQIVSHILLWQYLHRTEGIEAIGAILYVILVGVVSIIVNSIIIIKTRRHSRDKIILATTWFGLFAGFASVIPFIVEFIK